MESVRTNYNLVSTAKEGENKSGTYSSVQGKRLRREKVRGETTCDVIWG